MGAPYTPKQEDVIIDEMMVEDQPLVPRVDKFVGQERWGVGVPMFDYRSGLTVLEKWHLGLATTGMASGLLEPLGMAADAADFLLYTFEGDKEGAAWAGVRFIPVVGVAGYFGSYFKKAKEGTESYFKMVHKAAVHEQLLQTHKIVRSIEHSGDVGPLIRQLHKLVKLPEWKNRPIAEMIPYKIYAGQVDPKNWRMGEKFKPNPLKKVEEQIFYLDEQITKMAPDYFDLRRKLNMNIPALDDMVSHYLKNNPGAKRMLSDKKVGSVLDHMVDQGFAPKLGEGVLREVDKIGARTVEEIVKQTK